MMQLKEARCVVRLVLLQKWKIETSAVQLVRACLPLALRWLQVDRDQEDCRTLH